MYAITIRERFYSSEEVLIYNDKFPTDDTTIIDAVLHMSVNAAGSLELTIPPSNVGYDKIHSLTTEFIVYRNEDGMKEIWRGRVILKDLDFWNNWKLTCEGELAYFNDTIQSQGEWHDVTVEWFLNHLLYTYNDSVSNVEDRWFLGTVEFTDELYRYTNYETTWECIFDKLIDRLGGILRIRHESDGKRYLDYLSGYPDVANQDVTFGSNILDISQKIDMCEYATVVIPLGEKLEESQYTAIDEYLTVESVNGGSIYIVNDEAVNAYGRKEIVVSFDDISDAQKLYNKGVAYLNEMQYEDMTIEVDAIDLHMTDEDISSINLLDVVPVFSAPHKIDTLMPVTEIEIPLNKPQEAHLTLNGYKNGKTYKMSYMTKKMAQQLKSVMGPVYGGVAY